MAGPALFFFAVEQGDAFAAEAARAILVALVGVAASGLAYAWASLRAPWWISLAVSWSSFVAATLALQRIGWSALSALAVDVTSFLVAQMLLAPSGEHAPPLRPRWDLPLRAISSMIVVVSVTAVAAHLGPGLSGALTPFLIAMATLLAFTPAQQESSAAIRFLRGFLPGMWGLAAFCFVAALTIAPLGK